MKPFKRFALLICGVSALVAMVAPAAAGASQLEQTPGTLLKVGSIFQSKATGPTLNFSSLGKVECGEWVLRSKLAKNDGTTVEAAGTGEFTSSECRLFTAKAMNMDNLISTTPGKGTASFTFSLQFGATTCKYSGTNLPFTYTLGGSQIVFSQASGLKGGPCGTAQLSAVFTLSAGGSPLIFN